MAGRGVKRKMAQAQLGAARRDREPTGRSRPVKPNGVSPSKGAEFRGRVTGEFDGGYLATVRWVYLNIGCRPAHAVVGYVSHPESDPCIKARYS